MNICPCTSLAHVANINVRIINEMKQLPYTRLVPLQCTMGGYPPLLKPDDVLRHSSMMTNGNWLFPFIYCSYLFN